MIVSKVYDVNGYNIDEVITELAKEINNGYTISYIEYEPYSLSCHSINNKASAHIHLKHKDSKYES